MDREKILIVIPVFNHGQTLRVVVRKALAVHAHVLVVDDGSTDGAARNLHDLSCSLLSFPENRGKGAALCAAAKEAARRGMTHIITLDADGQHDPGDIPGFFEAIEQNPWALIVGARDFSVPHVPGSSKFGRQFSRFWLRVQTGVDLSDPQSGFRAYPVAFFTQTRFREKRYAFEIEILAKAAWAGLSLCSIPVSVYYAPGKERISHFRLLRDNAQISVLNTRLTMRAMLPVPHRRLTTDSTGKVTVLRPLESLRLLLADNQTPGQLALSAALGMFLGTAPLPGLHSLSIIVCAGYFRLNVLCALAVSQLCMPPFVPALAIEVGHYLRHGVFLTEFSLQTLGYQFMDRLWEWVLGACLLAPFFAILAGLCVYIPARFLQYSLERRA